MGISFTAEESYLRHINIRKDGDDEDAITAIDLKINCETGGAVLLNLLGADKVPNLWHDNEDSDALYNGISEINTWPEFEDHELQFCGLNFKNAKLKKFSFKPIAKKQVELTFSASIKQPTQHEINMLVEMLHCSSELLVLAPPDLFEDNQQVQEKAKNNGQLDMGLDIDPLYGEAVLAVKESGKASISFVQRKMKIGYNRAARLIERMEEDGVVSFADHAGVRTVTNPN